METIWVDASPLMNGGPIKLSLCLEHDDGTYREMSGDFPALWTEKEKSVFGPLLYDDNFMYRVYGIDYAQKTIRLERV